ncbi:MAG: CvpA family protein [Methylococcaceae bacterium]|nr:CvpA family protein [Methylococcaceae bacterium]
MTLSQSVSQFFTQMIWIDYAITVMVAMCLVGGLLRGAGREMQSLFSWLLASAIGWSFADDFNRVMNWSISDTNAQIAAAFTILFVITLVVSGFVFFLLNYAKKQSHISIVSHILGIPVGFLRSLILAILVVILAGLTPLPNESWWHQSKMIPPFQTATTWLQHHFPSGLSGYIRYR